jgi:hypothetical protein
MHENVSCYRWTVAGELNLEIVPTNMMKLTCCCVTTGRSVLELQQPAHHRSRRNRLHARGPFCTRTEAILRKDLRIPRRHLCLTRLFGINKWDHVQTSELVPFRQFPEERY